VRIAVRHLLSEENLSSSSLASLPFDLKAHLASCAECAAEAAVLDPALVFAPLAASVSPEPASTGRRPAPPVAEDARFVADAVLEEVRRRARVTPDAPAAPGPSWWRTHRVARAAALVAIAAGLAGLVRWERVRPVEPAGTIAATSVGPRALTPAGADVPARPLIEGMRSPNARVYEFASASPQEPAVVFVANPNADL
jgi:hypothetical protein